MIERLNILAAGCVEWLLLSSRQVMLQAGVAWLVSSAWRKSSASFR